MLDFAKYEKEIRPLSKEEASLAFSQIMDVMENLEFLQVIFENADKHKDDLIYYGAVARYVFAQTMALHEIVLQLCPHFDEIK